MHPPVPRWVFYYFTSHFFKKLIVKNKIFSKIMLDIFLCIVYYIGVAKDSRCESVSPAEVRLTSL